MGGIKLDGAGTQKMKTLEEGLLTLQRIHGLVERAAVDMKNQRPIGTMPQQVKRIAVPLQGQLKGQFGMIADQVAAFILSSTRGGGGDQAKIRGMREGIAQLRTAMELSVNKVKAEHAVPIEISGD
ncbi:MAG: hypothetical protein FJ202_00205 [Gemmatimonadetes bacterium]|nr:hypothetical protein [Gemmatimonadota bacterium]